MKTTAYIKIEFRDLLIQLQTELSQLANLLYDNQGNQALSKAYIMLMFANLDGILWVLRKEMINSDQFIEIFSLEEQAELLEKEFDKQKKEINYSRTIYQELRVSLKFTLKCFARYCKLPDYQFPNKCSGWQAMCNAIQIRNDITHPKNTKFQVTEEDLRIVIQAKEWFGEQVMKPFVDQAIRNKAGNS